MNLFEEIKKTIKRGYSYLLQNGLTLSKLVLLSDLNPV